MNAFIVFYFHYWAKSTITTYQFKHLSQSWQIYQILSEYISHGFVLWHCICLKSYCTLYKCESPYKRSDTDHVCGDSLTLNCVGREGPWTTPSSSLSPPKLVINSTFVFFGSSGEQDRDLDDEDLLKTKTNTNVHHEKIKYLRNINNNKNNQKMWN